MANICDRRISGTYNLLCNGKSYVVTLVKTLCIMYKLDNFHSNKKSTRTNIHATYTIAYTDL